MLEDLLEINPVSVVITLVCYGFCMLVLWKGLTGWRLQDQIIISIIALPLLYFAVNYQINRG